jgi:hypothetical protein
MPVDGITPDPSSEIFLFAYILRRLRSNVTEPTIYDEALVLLTLCHRVSNYSYGAPLRARLVRLRLASAQQRSSEHAKHDMGWHSGRRRVGRKFHFRSTLIGVCGMEVRMCSHIQDVSLLALTFR